MKFIIVLTLIVIVLTLWGACKLGSDYDRAHNYDTPAGVENGE